MKNIRKFSSFNVIVVLSLTTGLGIVSALASADDGPRPAAHSDSMGAAVSDTVTTAKVKAKLMGEDGLGKSQIRVTTTNGVVTLEGSASSSRAKSMAESDAKSIEGVKSVDDNLKTPASSEIAAETGATVAKTERVMSDSWITTKVKSEILASSISKGVDVRVDTTHGVVVLKGVLANQDAVDHVKDIAEKVTDVKSVDTSALTVAGR